MFSHSSAVSLNHHWPTWLWPVFWPDLIPTHPTRSWPAGHTCSKIRLRGGNCSLLTSVELCTFAQFFEKKWKIAKAHTLSVGTHSQYKCHQGCTELITPICLGPAWTLHHGIDIKKLKEFDLRKLRLHHKESSTNVFCIHVRAQVQQQQRGMIWQ